ncbi:MAG TPA: class I SAM-dependent methyltransferase [Patescibacteria group bacterium]|nr:class I SAM-dependent methyltransferase [Patescibacteria group bacterium]
MIEKRIESYWNGRADTYSALVKKEMACRKKQAWEFLLREYAGGQENLQVLDVGTGPGFFATLLAGLNYSVTAIDKCEEMLKEARINAAAAATNIKFMQADAHFVNLPDESLDLVVSRNVTWLLPNPLEAYGEWQRLLKPGGKALVFDANWHLEYSDPLLAAECEKHRQLAAEKGFCHKLTPEQKQESEAIARKLPLTYQKRPDWDRMAFKQCGFQQVKVRDDISALVHDELEQLLYKPTPMFAICAIK